MLVLLAEAKLVALSARLLLKLYNQFGLSACEIFFTNWVVPLLFKCNLFLLRHEASILLFMNRAHLPLDKFSNFLLISLIFSSNPWSLWWMKPQKALCTSLWTAISLMVVMTFLTFWSVLTLFWMSLVSVWMMIKSSFLQADGLT